MATQKTIMPWPQPLARFAGFLYLVVIVGGMFAELGVRSKLIVPGEAEITASNILAHETLFRWGFVSDVVAIVCDIALAMLLYVLMRPVGKVASLLAAVFELSGDAILALVSLLHLAAIVILAGTPYMAAFSVDQLHALARLCLKLHGLGYAVSLVPISLRDLLLGTLIYRSGYLPKLIGLLLVLTGVIFLFVCYANFLAPAMPLPGYILMPGLLGEGSLTLWLLVKGVNAAKWRERAVNTGQS